MVNAPCSGEAVEPRDNVIEVGVESVPDGVPRRPTAPRVRVIARELVYDSTGFYLALVAFPTLKSR